MSFSSEVKEEIAGNIGGARHCQIAELAAFLIYGGNTVRITPVENAAEKAYQILFRSDNLFLVEKFNLLLRRLFHIHPEIQEETAQNRNNATYYVSIGNARDAERILYSVNLLEDDGTLVEFVSLEHARILQQECCRRAFLRGAFLVSGSISDPNRSYHLEIACQDTYAGAQLCGLVCAMDVNARSIIRKKYHVVYVKESDEISRLLSLMGSRVEMMNFENIRILREVRGNVNRKVNCETANIHKTVTAAVRQVEDIEYIRDTIGFESLPKVLDEMARVRLQYREASLKELGAVLDPPVGKSGVNHRLRKLSKIAEDIRQKKQEGHLNGQ